jgi:hypothetical protein
MHVVYANLISDGNPIDAIYQYIKPWCVGKGWKPVAFMCARYSIVYVSVLFTVSLNGSARYLSNAVDLFCIYPVVCVFWEAQRRKICDLRYHKTSRGAEESHKTTVKLADLGVVYKKIMTGVFLSLKPKYHMLKLHQVGFGRFVGRGVGWISGVFFKVMFWHLLEGLRIISRIMA